jgi:hypothetical protein
MVGTPDDDSWATLPRRLDRRTAAWLVDAVAPGSRPGTWHPGESAPPDLVTAAQIHGVEGWVRQRALASGTVLDGVDAAVHAALGRHQRALADVGRVDAALSSADVQFLVVKGPAVTRWYAEPSLRSYVDLDVVVSPLDLGRALDALEAAGFALLDANWPFLLTADVHELALRTPSGGALDLHWSLGPSPMSIDRSPDFEVLRARSVEFVAGPVAVHGLGDADALVHLAVHAAASGGHRLVWLTDLRAAITATAPDPVVLGRAAAEWGAVPALDLMLRRLRWALGDETGKRHEQRPWHPWAIVASASNALSSPERSGAGPSLPRLVARASRDSAASSFRSFGAKAGSRVLGRGQVLTRAQLLDPTSPASARHAAGGPEGREEFVRFVLNQRR